MAKFCGKCGTPINDNAMFCGKCGTKVEVTNYAYQPMATSTPTLNNSNKTHWILSILSQIICVVLFFLPTVKLEALWVDSDISVFEQVSEAGYSAIYIILLILFFLAVIVMLLPVLQGNILKNNSLLFMEIVSVLFFIANVIFYIIIGNEVKKQGFGVVEYSLNAWGWIYIIVSIISIINLFILSSKTKKS